MAGDDEVVDVERDVERLAAGDLSSRVEIRTNDEFGVLGETFNRMAAEIRDHQDRLVDEERRRKEQEIQQRLFDEPPEQDRTLADVPHTYHTVESAAERAALIEKLEQQSCICFDTETTGRDPRAAAPLGIAFAFAPGEAYYVTLPAEEDACQAVLHQFLPIFTSERITKVGHNLKYDQIVLRRFTRYQIGA